MSRSRMTNPDRRLLEPPFDFFEGRFEEALVRFGLDAEALLEFLEELFLLGVQAAGVGEAYLRDQIPLASAVDVADPLAAEAVLLGVLGPRFEF